MLMIRKPVVHSTKKIHQPKVTVKPSLPQKIYEGLTPSWSILPYEKCPHTVPSSIYAEKKSTSPTSFKKYMPQFWALKKQLISFLDLFVSWGLVLQNWSEQVNLCGLNVFSKCHITILLFLETRMLETRNICRPMRAAQWNFVWQIQKVEQFVVTNTAVGCTCFVVPTDNKYTEGMNNDCKPEYFFNRIKYVQGSTELQKQPSFEGLELGRSRGYSPF